MRLIFFFPLAQFMCVTGAFSTSDGTDIVSTTTKTHLISDVTKFDPSMLSTYTKEDDGAADLSTSQANLPVHLNTDGQETNGSTASTSQRPRQGVSPTIDNGVQQTPPTITFPDSSATIIVYEKENYHLQCTANGYPQPSYFWYRGGVQVTERGEYIKAFTNGTLFFKDFSSRESGWYQCTATNQYGTSVSNVFHLVKVSDSIIVDENSTTTTLKPWQPYSVMCKNVPVTYPKVKVRWYNGANDQIRTDERIGQDEAGTLHLAYVLPEDDDKVFSCALFNAQTSTIKVARMGHLLVTEKNTDLVDKHPSIQYSTGYVEAILGEEVILECFIAGVPLADIKWKNSSNHEIIKDRNSRFELLDNNRKLRVRNVNVNDEGIFSCQGTNIAGTVEGPITVNVTSPPLLTADGALISQTIADNQIVTLKCKTKPAPSEHVDTPIWYRNGQLLTQDNVPDNDRYQFNTDMTELMIRDLDKEKDIANFQCNVTNSKGFRFFDAFLRVIDSIQITKRPSDVITIEEDDIVDFTVQATGDKCCAINSLWYFNSSQVDINQPPFVLNRTTDSLYFDATSVPLETLKRWMGRYTCRVSDFYQNVSVSVVVRLKEDEKIPNRVTAAEANTGLWWIGLLCGLVAIAIAVIIVLIIVYKRKNPGETYKLEQQELKHNLNPEEDLLNQSFQDI